MKQLFVLFLLSVLGGGVVSAQSMETFPCKKPCSWAPTKAPEKSPSTISYQGLLSTDKGVLMEGSVTMLFKMYDAPSGGNLLWTETQILNISDGRFNTMLGKINPVSNIPAASKHWLSVTVDGKELSTRTELSLPPGCLNAPVKPKAVDKISYQGIMGDQNNPMNGKQSMTFHVLSPIDGKTILWDETQTVNFENGRFNVMLGSVNPMSGLQPNTKYGLCVKVGDKEIKPAVEFVLPVDATQQVAAPGIQ